jgi:hypothetical protein
MNTLSRREEETLKKITKARALQECDPIVRGSCASTRITNFLRWLITFWPNRVRGVRPRAHCEHSVGMQGEVSPGPELFVPVVRRLVYQAYYHILCSNQPF